MVQKEELLRIQILGALLVAITLIIAGTLAYHGFEGWSYVDSLYFSVTTLTTVGYGDFHPTNDNSKIFTVAYIFFGVSIIFYLLSLGVGYFMRKHVVNIEKRVYSKLGTLKKNVVIRKKK